MNILDQIPILDDILGDWRAPLGDDFIAYRNHCYRVVNFTLALSRDDAGTRDKSAIAAAFHDLGIWTDRTYDYLEPSRQLARRYLVESRHGHWADEIKSMIEFHHKLRRYTARPEWLVEPFRKADWIDVTRGRLRFGLSPDRVAAVQARFPNAGFHRRLSALTRQRLRTHPLNPLPMMRW